MSAKWARWRKPDARFLTILTMRLSPAPTALVKGAVDEGQDVREVRPEGANERPHGGEATAAGRGHPACENFRAEARWVGICL